jgi:predicted ABC-type sugar transport system permease subunit
MMTDKKKMTFLIDEREQRLTASIATIFLFLTQIGLAVIILVRRYVQHQTNEQISDLNLLLALSLFGFAAVRLLLNAGLPALTIKTTLRLYIGFVFCLSLILTLWFGFPQPAEWSTTLLPVALFPAILLALYHGFSILGRKLLEKELEE